MKRKMYLFTLIGVLALAISLTAPGIAGAVTGPAQGGSGSGAKGDAFDPAKATARIDRAVEKLEQFKEKRLASFEEVRDKLEKAIDSFADKGLDVSALEDHIAELESKVEGAAGACDKVIGQLEDTKGLAKPETAAEFKSALKSAMAGAKAVRKDIKELRSYMNTVIRKDIQKLRAQAARGSEGTK